MSKLPIWNAEHCTKSKNMDGLHTALQSIDEMPQEEKNQAIAGLVQTAMMGKWVEGVHALLNVKGAAFPTESIRDGLDSFVAPTITSQTENLLRVLSYHQEKLPPSLKAEIGMEFGPYMTEQSWNTHRASGLISAVDNDKTAFRMHGASSSQGALAPERVAALLMEMPEGVRASIYNRQLTAGITGVPREVGHFSADFMAKIMKDDVLFNNELTTEKKFTISPKHLANDEFVKAADTRGILKPEDLAEVLKIQQARTAVAPALKDDGPKKITVFSTTPSMFSSSPSI
jgi:hypothetical protein